VCGQCRTPKEGSQACFRFFFKGMPETAEPVPQSFLKEYIYNLIIKLLLYITIKLYRINYWYCVSFGTSEKMTGVGGLPSKKFLHPGKKCPRCVSESPPHLRLLDGTQKVKMRCRPPGRGRLWQAAGGVRRFWLDPGVSTAQCVRKLLGPLLPRLFTRLL
jgi:hypothetical protein